MSWGEAKWIVDNVDETLGPRLGYIDGIIERGRKKKLKKELTIQTIRQPVGQTGQAQTISFPETTIISSETVPISILDVSIKVSAGLVTNNGGITGDNSIRIGSDGPMIIDVGDNRGLSFDIPGINNTLSLVEVDLDQIYVTNPLKENENVTPPATLNDLLRTKEIKIRSGSWRVFCNSVYGAGYYQDAFLKIKYSYLE